MKTCALWGLIIFLGAAGAFTTGIGFVRLVRGPYSDACDLHKRWVEERNVANHRDPSTYSADAVEPYEPHVSADRFAVLYPAWAFGSELIFVPPISWPAVRWYFALECAAGLGFMMAWAWSIGRPIRPQAGWLLAVIMPAMLPVSYTLSQGQYGLVIAALLIACMALAEKRLDMAAGWALGLAMLKPTIALPFAIAYGVLGRWRLLAISAGWMALMTVAAWALIGIDPITLAREESQWVHIGYIQSHNLLNLIALRLGWGDGAAGLIPVVVLPLELALLLWARRRGCSDLTLMSIAAVASQFCTYRKEYDTVIMAVLVVAAGAAALRHGGVWSLAIFAMVVLSVCFPWRMRDHDFFPAQVSEAVAWLLGVAMLMVLARGEIPRPVRAVS